MRYRRLGGKLPLLLSIHLIFYLSTTVTNTASDLAAGVIEQYGYSSYGFVPLRIDSDVVLRRRLRRQAAASTTTAAAKLSDEDDDEPNMAATRPPGIEDEDDNLSTSHMYYKMTPYVNDPDSLKKYYVNMLEWTSKKGVTGATRHEHLTNSYRKAAGIKLSFEFPFYGHRLTNLTIATGGFIYVGDQTHSWLAATQYIAPLMANFDTTSGNATIMYGDDGERMIVEWSNVSLRDNRNAGKFTFQVHLYKTGDIYFVYKDVPISPKNISDGQHPCKFGISDAYLFNHRASNSDKTQGVTQSKRIIHEYHRISIEPEKIMSNTVIILSALPTCLGFTTCDSCTHANLKLFHCSWCSPTEAAEKAFCSDQIGLNRRRQEWVEGNCADTKRDNYCEAPSRNASSSASASTKDDEASTLTNNNSSGNASSSSVLTSTTVSASSAPLHPHKVVPLSNRARSSSASASTAEIEEAGGSSGVAFITVLTMLVIGAAVWTTYAFYNPHTTSGQLLIKYRPSKWQIPSSHVRYSASVHM